MKHCTHLILLFFILSFFSLNAQAREVYKWVDENGKTHYGDAPTGNKATTVKVPHAAPSSSGSSAAKTPKNQLDAVREKLLKKKEARTAKKEEKAHMAKEQAKMDKHCQALKNNLRTLTEGSRVFTYDDKGERVFMADDTRAAKKADLQKQIQKNCK